MLSLILAAVGAVTPCQAVVPTDQVCLEWVAPETDTAGMPIVLEMNYHIFRQVGTTWVLQAVAVTSGFQITGLPLGKQCFRFTAFYTSNGAESGPSPPACKTLKLAAPSDGSIEAPTDGSIEFPK